MHPYVTDFNGAIRSDNAGRGPVTTVAGIRRRRGGSGYDGNGNSRTFDAASASVAIEQQRQPLQ